MKRMGAGDLELVYSGLLQYKVTQHEALGRGLARQKYICNLG